VLKKNQYVLGVPMDCGQTLLRHTWFGHLLRHAIDVKTSALDTLLFTRSDVFHSRIFILMYSLQMLSLPWLAGQRSFKQIPLVKD
jgi:hypothetical protein